MEDAVRALSRVGIVLIALVVVIHALGQWSLFVVPVLSGLVIGVMLSLPMQKMESAGLPTPLAAMMALTAIALAAALIVLLLAAPFQEWLNDLPRIWGRLLLRLAEWQSAFPALDNVRAIIERAGADEDAVKVQMEQTGFITSVLTLAPSAIGQIILFFGTLILFLGTRARVRLSILSLCFHRSSKLRAARIIRDCEHNISSYLLTITLINMALGTATGLVMWLLGMPTPVMWGLVAGLMNYLPFIGPWIVGILLAGTGLITYDSLAMAAAPALAFLALNMIEWNIVTPAVLGRTLTLNPLTVFLAIAFGTWLWGPVGAFLAIPLLIAGLVVLSHMLPAPTRMRPAAPAGLATDLPVHPATGTMAASPADNPFPGAASPHSDPKPGPKPGPRPSTRPSHARSPS